MSRFLSLTTALFDAPSKPTSSPPPAPAGSALFFHGTDADYPGSGIPQRRKTQHRWLGVWQEEADVDRFLAAPAAQLPALSGALSVGSLKLVPYLRRGSELFPLDVHPVRPGADEPIAIVTSIGTYATESEIIAASQAANASRASLTGAEGLLHEMLLIPFLPAALDLFTVTAWRTEGAARDWAYRTDAHRGAMDFYKGASEQPRVSFTRCRIAATFGDWPDPGVVRFDPNLRISF